MGAGASWAARLAAGTKPSAIMKSAILKAAGENSNKTPTHSQRIEAASRGIKNSSH
jgi:hypothetical protein